MTDQTDGLHGEAAFGHVASNHYGPVADSTECLLSGAEKAGVCSGCSLASATLVRQASEQDNRRYPHKTPKYYKFNWPLP